ncbi:hypothetical protein GCM10027093_45190 [Paraburkholderia jirisanensis]
MASSSDTVSMALFCDFENVALGVRDAKYEKFDIKLVLERLLLKGSIVVKKAYCDWDRYKGFKAAMHEANFELIEIPHVRQSGKNSADIRLVVDALDLCYTKSHVNTFVIISGDSDFSPLVSKLRENAKQVIGVGVQRSTSDLLTANCDEFIFYDDLVRENQRAAAKREAARAPQPAQNAAKRAPDGDKQRKEDLDTRKTKAIEFAVQTFDALATERGDSGKIWASVLKNAIKRRKPDFNETYYGFRAFGNLLEEAQARGLLEVGRDEKSGTYVYRNAAAAAAGESAAEPIASVAQRLPAGMANEESLEEAQSFSWIGEEASTQAAPAALHTSGDESAEATLEPRDELADNAETGRKKQRTARKPAAKKARKSKKAAGDDKADSPRAGEQLPLDAAFQEVPAAIETETAPAVETAGKPARKSSSRGRRSRSKAAASSDAG